MRSTYERVRVQGRTIILKNPAETQFLGAPALTGIEVNREGDEIAGRGADERRHIIALTEITRRTPLVMDDRYGELTEA